MFRRFVLTEFLCVISQRSRDSLGAWMWRNCDNLIAFYWTVRADVSRGHENSREQRAPSQCVFPVFALLAGSQIKIVLISVENKQREPFLNSFKKWDVPSVEQHITRSGSFHDILKSIWWYFPSCLRCRSHQDRMINLTLSIRSTWYPTWYCQFRGVLSFYLLRVLRSYRLRAYFGYFAGL